MAKGATYSRHNLPLIKHYPEVFIAALKAKKDKELALWYELRPSM